MKKKKKLFQQFFNEKRQPVKHKKIIYFSVSI